MSSTFVDLLKTSQHHDYEQVRFCGLDEQNQATLDRLIRSLVAAPPMHPEIAKAAIEFSRTRAISIPDAYRALVKSGEFIRVRHTETDATVDLSSRGELIALAAVMIESNASDLPGLREAFEGAFEDEGHHRDGLTPLEAADELIAILTIVGRHEAIEGSR